VKLTIFTGVIGMFKKATLAIVAMAYQQMPTIGDASR
jgi:hypothetical protein